MNSCDHELISDDSATQKEKLQILIIAKEYPPYVSGGLGIHYYELIRELKQSCHVKLISSRDNYDSPSEEHFPGLDIYRIHIPKLFPLDHIVFNAFAYLKSLQFEVDVTHICSPFGVLNVLLKRTPTVVKFHTLYTRQEGSWIYNHLYFPIASLIDHIFLKRTDLILTTSRFMKQDIMARFPWLPEDKVKVILNGVSRDFFIHTEDKKSLRRLLEVDVDARIILFVGRLVQRKGAINLIRAIPDVIKIHPNSIFLFVGTGFSEGSEYEKHIEKEIDHLNVAKYVKVIPWLERTELLNYYRIADLFVHPALYEPFGMVVAEALAAGLPVIASKSGGPEEIIKDAGILLENNAQSNLARNIIELLNSSSRMMRYSKLSVERAREFSWHRAAEETVEMCKSLMPEN